GEYRRALGPARDHKTLAEDKIFEPALLRHHAMLGGIEVGHGWFLRIWDGWRDTGIAAIELRQLVQFDCRDPAPFYFAWGCFRDFGSGPCGVGRCSGHPGRLRL